MPFKNKADLGAQVSVILQSRNVGKVLLPTPSAAAFDVKDWVGLLGLPPPPPPPLPPAEPVKEVEVAEIPLPPPPATDKVLPPSADELPPLLTDEMPPPPIDELSPPPTDELPPPPMDELPPPLPPPLADDLLMPPRDLPPPAPEVTSATPADGAPEDSTPLTEDVAPVVRDDKSDALGDHPPPPSADDLFEGRGAPGYLPPPPPPAAPAPAAKESVKPDISKSPPPAPQHPLSSGALRMQARWLDLQLEQLQRQRHDVMEASFYAMKMDFQRLERENEALRHRTAYLEAELRGYERNADYFPDPHLVGQLQRVCSCRSHLLVPSMGRTAVYSMDTRDLALLDVSTQSEEFSCDPL